MALLAALALFAAPATGGVSAPVHVPTKAVAPARATARILSGARINLSASPQPEGHKLTAAQVTLEDGRRRPAQLVEFQ